MHFLTRFFARSRLFSARSTAISRDGGAFAVGFFGQLLTGALLLTAAFGCSASSKGVSGGDGDEPTPPEPTDEETIAFVPDGTLSLAPSELAGLSVEVMPLRRQNVVFEILTETAGFDGFLVQSEVRVRDDGTATVELHAPSIPALFTVRASLPEGSRAVRTVTVGAQGYGVIDVIPNYDGTRDIAQWTASARLNETCETLDSYWEDGPLIATGASRVAILDVPSGVPAAVTIRGGQLAVGCVTLTGLRADDVEEIEIEVNDRPVDVNKGTLSLSLGIDSSTAVFIDHLNETRAAGSDYFQADSSTDSAALLAAMSNNLDALSRTEFVSAIATHNLIDAVHIVYGQADPITAAITALLGNAAAEITGPDVFQGLLTLQGVSSQFQLTQVVGVEPTQSGFFQGSTWTVRAESGDMVVLGGTLSYEPLRWLTAIADSRASEGHSPLAQIVEAASCLSVASTIVSTVGGPPFSECDENCLSELCADSVAPVWTELLEAGPALTTLQLGVSGHAELFGSAQIEMLSGSWVGRLGTEDETSVGGTAHSELVLDE